MQRVSALHILVKLIGVVLEDKCMRQVCNSEALIKIVLTLYIVGR